MKINNSYAVFGLGRYGVAVAKELSDSGADVLAVDMNEDIVNEVMKLPLGSKLMLLAPIVQQKKGEFLHI